MQQKFVRFCLFLSSYFPLALIFFILLVYKHFWIAVGIMVIGTLGLVVMIVYFWCAGRVAPLNITIAELRRHDEEAMLYMVSYVLPFLAIPFERWEEAVALIIFFIILGLLYVNSNRIHINPMLSVVGYHIYEVTSARGNVYSIITRSHLIPGQDVAASPIPGTANILIG